MMLSFLSPLGASRSYVNDRKIFPVGSSEYENLVLLYISTGRSQPSSAGPWSADELLGMLETIPYDSLSDSQRALYDEVAFALEVSPRLVSDDGFGFTPSMILAPEFYFHVNEEFDTEPDWNYGFTERTAPIGVRFEAWSAEHFYGFVELSLGLTRYHSDDLPISTDGPDLSREELYALRFRSNIPMFGVAKLGELSMNIPYRAFLSVGGSHWNLQIGRDRLSWGPGESGNLILGSHYPMHQFLRLSNYHDAFKYTFVASFFPHPVNYRPDEDVDLSVLSAEDIEKYDRNEDGIVDATEYFIGTKLSDPNHQMQGLSMFMGHRFEFRMFQDRLALAISETIMYQTLDGYFDLQVLNPMMLFHNMYIRGNANSLLGFDIDFTPYPGVNIYGTFLLDDLAAGEEPTSGEDANPNAVGGLLGVKLTFPYGYGAFFGSLEGVYADPYLYKRDGDVEYIVAFRESNNTAGDIGGTGIKYHKYYLGYRYGGDVIVGNLRFGYTAPGRYTASLLAQIRFKGLVDLNASWSKYSEEASQHAPTTSLEAGVVRPVEVTLRLEPSVEMRLGQGISFRSSVGFVTQWHRDHADEAGPLFDVQIIVGAAYRI